MKLKGKNTIVQTYVLTFKLPFHDLFGYLAMLCQCYFIAQAVDIVAS